MRLKQGGKVSQIKKKQLRPRWIQKRNLSDKIKRQLQNYKSTINIQYYKTRQRHKTKKKLQPISPMNVDIESSIKYKWNTDISHKYPMCSWVYLRDEYGSIYTSQYISKPYTNT